MGNRIFRSLEMVKGIGHEYECRGMSDWRPSRRTLLRALGTATVAGTAASGVSAQNGSPTTESWAEFAADPANTGFAPTNTGPIDSKEEDWRFETAENVLSSPAVVAPDGQDGEDGATVYVGSNDGNVYAIDAGDGTERWRFETDGKVSSSPAVLDGTVYVGSNDGNVYAIATADGTERWRFETDGAVLSAPTVVDGTVYVGSDDETVYAIATDDGSETWTHSTDGAVWSSPAVVDGTVYVGSNDNTSTLCRPRTEAGSGARKPPTTWNRPRPWRKSRATTRRPSSSAVSTGSSTRSRPATARSGGAIGSRTRWTPRRPWPTGRSTWAVSTDTSTRSTPTTATGSGGRKPTASSTPRRR